MKGAVGILGPQSTGPDMKLCDNKVDETKTFRCTISDLEPLEQVIFFQIPLTNRSQKV